ncbi:MAG: hypothetical protein A2X23_10500 [Chloroflexi bacterium GWC2_73_18]|nr:MAG: hypothetical protein A2X23_10500 [Chloroflexi bacterium GWC2_73_18]
MIRKLAALMVGGILAAAVYGAASTLIVSSGTAATGQGAVDNCGDVTGSTYLLYGTGISGQTFTEVTGAPSDITKVTWVNIETGSECYNINLFVQLKDGSENPLDGVGFCEVTATGGLGWNEAWNGDNTYGCTVALSTPVNVSAIEFLVVTET